MNVAPLTSIIDSLGWTLVHFVWQATAIALTAWCLLALARKTLPQVRYIAGCAALLLMAAGAASTFVWHLAGSEIRATRLQTTTRGNSAARRLGLEGSTDNAHVDLETATGNSLQMARDVPATAERAAAPEQEAASYFTSFGSFVSRLRPWLTWIVSLWATGVGFLSLRLFASWSVIRRMRAEGHEPEDKVWTERFARLRQRLGVSRPVRLLCSASATVPIVIGWLKPVVLVPAGLFTGLNSKQLEPILAHELAHIRRHDYLVNLLQNVLETLFFYHPAVWWVSKQIRKEREHCCDDLAVAACGGVLEYARALTTLEELRRAPAVLGVAASGGSLLERVRRLAGAKQTDPHGKGWPVAAIVFVLGAAILLAAVSGSSVGQQKDVPPTPSVQTSKPEVSPKPKAEANVAAQVESAPVRDGIAITVLDSTKNKPIPEFRVLAGTRAGSVTSEEFKKRSGQDAVNWQPHTIRAGKGGRYVWPWKRAYNEMALRVEADGYEPQIWTWIKKPLGPTSIVFRLAADTGVNGRVLQPDGKPAVDAAVAITLPQRNARIENGRIHNAKAPLPKKQSDRWRRPIIVHTDAEGRFRLPSETDPASAVLVVHESGVCEMVTADFQKQPEITLKPWGRIEGQVLWKDSPGVDESICLSICRDQYGYPNMIGCYAETQTDAQGRFVFDKVLPGRAQLSRPVRLPESDEFGATTAFLEGLIFHVTVHPGEPTPALIGGQGRKVTGRLTGRTSWDNVTFHFHPNAPHIGFPGDNTMWKAFGVFRDSHIGPLFFRGELKPEADGSFEIPHLLPGRYQLFVSAPGVNNYAAYRTIKVDPETPGEAPPPIHLGEISLKTPDKAEARDSRESNDDRRDKKESSAKGKTARGQAQDSTGPSVPSVSAGKDRAQVVRPSSAEALRIVGRTTSTSVATVARRWIGDSPRSGDRSYEGNTEVILPATLTASVSLGTPQLECASILYRWKCNRC